MRFLFRLFVLGFIGLAVLPVFAPEHYREASAGGDPGEQAPSALELAALVGRAASDLRDICTRQPAVCETGSEAISFAGSRAREGLEIAYAIFRHGHPSMSERIPADVSGETTAGIPIARPDLSQSPAASK